VKWKVDDDEAVEKTAVSLASSFLIGVLGGSAVTGAFYRHRAWWLIAMLMLLTLVCFILSMRIHFRHVRSYERGPQQGTD